VGNPSILIIDDDPEFGADLGALLGSKYALRLAGSGEEALGAVIFDRPDAVILDLRMDGGRDGLAILDELRRLDPALPVIMATDHPSDETESEALRRGALYYVRKAAGRSEVVSKLEKALEVGGTARQRDGLKRELRESASVFLARSPSMRRLEASIDRVAAAPSTTVLLVGESGTGKSLVAREIHRRSARHAAPFLQVNLASQREELIDSELFGHKKGAFTGAIADRPGHFVAARGGTLFLDQVGSLPLSAQGRLLTALEEREILPVGSSIPNRVDVRVAAATSLDLSGQVEKGAFRQDLLGRLSVVTLPIPPLRERPDDIPDLVHYYLGRFAAEMGLANVSITAAAMGRLRGYSWRRNNVRELRNSLERSLVLHGHEHVLGPEAFDLTEERAGYDGLDYNDAKDNAVREFQHRFFARAFDVAGGSVAFPSAESIARVADLTHIPPQTVRRILRELQGQEPPV